MSREDFRSDLRGAFESISGPSSPSLSARVHEALVEAPERRGPVWLAGVAVAVIAVLLVGILFVAGPLSHRQILPPVPGGSPSPAASTSPAASPSPTDNLPAFQCAGTFTITDNQAPLSALVDGVRTGTHAGYDRITIEFQGGQPATIELTTQSGTTFNQGGGKGGQVTLEGSSGILIKLYSADGHTAYTGPTDLKTGYPVMLEAREVGDYEGYVDWALGLSTPACYRAFTLINPTRLVVDIQTS